MDHLHKTWPMLSHTGQVVTLHLGLRLSGISLSCCCWNKSGQFAQRKEGIFQDDFQGLCYAVEAEQRRRWANIGYTTTKGMITRSRAAPWARAASGTGPHRLFVFIEVADPSRPRGKPRILDTPKSIIMHWMEHLVPSPGTCPGHSLDTLQVYWWLTMTDERSCRVGPRSVSMFRPWEQSGRDQQPSIFPHHLFDSTATRQPRSCCAFGSMRGERVRSGRLVSTWYAIKLLECSIMWHVQKKKTRGVAAGAI